MSIQSIPAGDTKAIVLALQGLQEKIRKLEDDRNFHRKQCEEAHAAHEAYKKEVEVQLERERIDHRRREDEIQSALRKVIQERRQLQESNAVVSTDLSAFKEQLNTILENERASIRGREASLREELESSKSEIIEQKAYYEKLFQTVAQLKAEREVILSTNKRLELTVSELLAMNGKILTGGDAARQKVNHKRKPSELMAAHRIAILAKSHPANASSISSGGKSASYQDPTVASMARVVEQQTSIRQPSPSKRSVSRENSRSQISVRAVSVDKRESLEGVYDEVEGEYRRLLTSYKQKLLSDKPNQNEINDLVAAIDQKADQLRLMRLSLSSRRDASMITVSPTRSPRGTQKAVQRGAIINQLRNMLS